MQRRFLSPLTLRAGALACAALLASPVTAAELGEVAVRSFVGQQLAADVELLGLAPDEMNGLPVRLASSDVYSGANLTPDPVLSSLHLSVVKRDQRWFLHMVTLRPVDVNHLYLYLELGSGEHQVVREATVWLAPDPHPAPPPVMMAAPELPEQAVPAVAPKHAAKITPKIASATSPATPSKALPSMSSEAPPKASPAVPPDVAPKAASGATGPDAALIAAIARARHPPAPVRAAVAEPGIDGEGPTGDPHEPKAAQAGAGDGMQGKLPATKAAAPRMAGAAKPPTAHEATKSSALPAGLAEVVPASCPVKPQRMAAKECIVLDSHSVAIASKIDELEDKVRVLQTALQVTSPVPKAAPLADAAAARAAGHAGLPKLKYRDKKDKPVEHGMNTSTLLAGGGVAALALVAGVLLWLRKRKAKKGGGPLKIWQGWRKRGGIAPEAGLPEAKPEEFMEPQ